MDKWEEEFAQFTSFMVGPDRDRVLYPLKDFIRTQREQARREGYMEAVEAVTPTTPEHWDNWSVERQLGYNLCWNDIQKTLKAKTKQLK